MLMSVNYNIASALMENERGSWDLFKLEEAMFSILNKFLWNFVHRIVYYGKK